MPLVVPASLSLSLSHTIYIHKEHEHSVKLAEEHGEPRPMDRIFLKLDPEARAKHLYESMCFTRWPAGIKSTHFWQFEWNDVRRRRLGSVWSNCGWYASAIRVKAEGVRLVNSPLIKAMNVNQWITNTTQINNKSKNKGSGVQGQSIYPRG